MRRPEPRNSCIDLNASGVKANELGAKFLVPVCNATGTSTYPMLIGATVPR